MRIVLLLAVGIGLSALLSYGVYRQILQPAQSREDAFAAYKSGLLLAGSDGVIQLPPRWAAASSDGKAYITRESSRVGLVLFLKSQGIGKRFSGYLFCTLPGKADAKGIVDLDYPTRGAKVSVRVMRVQTPWSFEVMSK